jgi:hypothetical protein
MKGLDTDHWSLWDWIGAVCITLGAVAMAVNQLFKDLPALYAHTPEFFGSAWWSYAPSILLSIGFGRVAYRKFHKAEKATQKPRTALGMFQTTFEPPSDFKLLPQQYWVDLSAPLPYVEARFFVVNYLPRAITLTQVRLSLRLFAAVPIEAIPLVNEDFEVQPKDASLIFCRRNLTDSELSNLPWRAGRDSGSFELRAKANDGDNVLSYAPMGALVIDGWVNGTATRAGRPPTSTEPR